ncbi:putative quinol monooxygenase [Gottfriedia luciferensis]|uniref:putative quinol monooxygenase n=1 Tax=Gottfriedia luciferensis TaxID=178774 RepID=UPI000B44F965|nr:putative quinol monooxygenase [Gottfriedia luciferensis]
MSKFGLFSRFIAKDGERDKLVHILIEASESLEKLKDCELYIVNTSDNEPNSVYVYEVWSNEDAHQASLTLETTQTLIKRAKPIITGIERISTLNPAGGKGIASSIKDI